MIEVISWSHLRTTSPRGIAVPLAETESGRGEALQAVGQGDSSNLEDADGGRAAVQVTERAGSDEGCL